MEEIEPGVTYLLGAGASAGSIPVQDGDAAEDFGRVNKYIEFPVRHVPIVGEWPIELEILANTIRPERIVKRDRFDSPIGFEEQNIPDPKLVMHLERCAAKARSVGTLDTYAKSVYLQQGPQSPEYAAIAAVTDIAMTYWQLSRGIDPRYVGWIAALVNRIDSETLTFPPGVKILSWNYDNQFETALARLCGTEAIRHHYLDGHKIARIKNPPVFHALNGKAGYLWDPVSGNRILNTLLMLNQSNRVDIAKKWLASVQDNPVDERPNGIWSETKISFAWEDRSSGERKRVYPLLQSDPTLVVIGYSFPAFNRRIDREILGTMGGLSRIIIQDPNAKSIAETLKEINPHENVEIIPQDDSYDQFFIPANIQI